MRFIANGLCLRDIMLRDGFDKIDSCTQFKGLVERRRYTYTHIRVGKMIFSTHHAPCAHGLFSTRFARGTR